MKVHCQFDELKQISELTLNQKNRDSHPKEQIKRLAKILDDQGCRYPFKVSSKQLDSPQDGRIEAAKLNGWKKVPISKQDYDSPEQEYEDSISDNSIASFRSLTSPGSIPILGV